MWRYFFCLESLMSFIVLKKSFVVLFLFLLCFRVDISFFIEILMVRVGILIRNFQIMVLGLILVSLEFFEKYVLFLYVFLMVLMCLQLLFFEQVQRFLLVDRLILMQYGYRFSILLWIFFLFFRIYRMFFIFIIEVGYWRGCLKWFWREGLQVLMIYYFWW